MAAGSSNDRERDPPPDGGARCSHDRVESVSLRHDKSRAVRSLDRMIESSTQRRAHHSNDVDPNSILVIDGAASTKSYGSRLPKPFAAWDARTPSRNSHRSRLFQLLSVCFVALFGLAAYLVLQRPFVLSGPPTAPPAKSSSAASQTDTSVAPSATLGGQSPRLTLPKVYGVYAISGGQLVQLETLAITVPDRRVFMSTPIKKASGTLLSDGRVTFIAFRRDIWPSRRTCRRSCGCKDRARDDIQSRGQRQHRASRR